MPRRYVHSAQQMGSKAAILGLYTATVALSLAAYANGQSDPSKACANAISVGQPACQHGGTLYYEDKDATHSTSCAHCNCPDGWRGTDCSICTSIDSCPSQKKGNRTVEAVACTNNTIILANEEIIHGKLLSCTCGGDAFSDFACTSQPDLNMMIELKGNFTAQNADATLSVKLFSGQPNQDAPCTSDACYPPERWTYAYPQAWEADFTGCKSTTTNCEMPMDAKDTCVVFECTDSDVSCPPKNVPKCPSFSTTKPYCGGFTCKNSTQCPPDGTTDYWQHHCYKSGTPPQHSPVKLRCRTEATLSGDRFHCAFAYEGMNFPSFIGLECSTGTCLYEDVGPPTPPPPYVPHYTKSNIPHLILILCCGLIAFAIGGFVMHDKRQSDSFPEELHARLLNIGAKDGQVALEDSLIEHHKSRNYISWSDLSCYKCQWHSTTVLVDKAIGWAGHLHDGDGLTAIMGPSGAGKTTLLDAIAGRSKKSVTIEGEVRLNGWLASPKQLRAISGYVMQEDILPGTSTVWEYFMFNAVLRMPTKAGKAYKRRRVLEVIEQLGLKKVAMNLIGDDFVRGLSGGEKRRLSIGIEILVCPPVLFLDEPLSGLDSSNASKVMSILTEIATTGVAVVLTLHQPRADMLTVIDRLMILSSGGCTVYSGPTSQLGTYLGEIGHAVPAESTAVDFLLELLVNSPDEVSEEVGSLPELCLETHDSFRSENGMYLWKNLQERRSRFSFFKEFNMLCSRSLKNAYRNKYVLFVNFFLSFLVSVSVGTIFWNSQDNTGGIQNRFGSIFFVLLYMGMMSLGLLPIWRDQWNLFLKEHGCRTYSCLSYFLNMVVFEIVLLRIIPPMFFAIFSYWMIGLNSSNGFSIFVFTLILMLTNVAANSLSILVGQISKSNSIANVIGTLSILVFVVFGGFFLNKNSIPRGLKWLADISFFNYAYEVMVINEFHYTDAMFNFTAPLSNSSQWYPTTGDGVLKIFGFVPDRFLMDILILVGITVALLCLNYVLLQVNLNRTYNNQFTKDDQRFQGIQGQGAVRQGSARAQYAKLDDVNVDIMDVHPPLSCNLRPEYLVLSWSQLNLSTKDRTSINAIVQNALGLSMKYAITAIMGPSGAGKTTLLDAIAGRSKKSVTIEGEVRLNGWLASPKQLRAISGYVMQEDILPGTSTVWEYFMFNAVLRMPTKAGKAYKRRRVLEVIEQLGLKKVAMNLIGDDFVRGLSGGEKRRLSIGIEILVCPPVLFLDEPLSGLDSSNASKVMSILTEIATTGVAVVLTLHQPRADMLTVIDRLMILSSGGCTVYSGPTSQLGTYLGEIGHAVPAESTAVDFLLDLLVESSDRTVARITDAFAKSLLMRDERKQLQQLITNTKNASHIPVLVHVCSPAKEVWVLFCRSVLANVRSPLLICLNLASSLLVAASVGFIFRDAGKDTPGIQKRMGSIFFMLLYLAMISLGSLPVWHQNYKVFQKEQCSRLYRVSSYFSAVVLNEFLLLRSIPPLIFYLSYYMITLRGGTSHILSFISVLMLTNCTLTGVIFVIGTATRKTTVANVIGSVVMLLYTLFAGFLLNRSDMSAVINVVARVSPLRYAFQILLINEFHGLPKGYFIFTDPSNKDAPGFPVSGDTILETFGFDTQGSIYDYAFISIILLISLVCSYVLLRIGTFNRN